MISNWDSKMQQSQIHLEILLLESISIIHQSLKDKNNKDKDLKAKIYYLALTTIFEYKYLLPIYVIYNELIC